MCKLIEECFHINREQYSSGKQDLERYLENRATIEGVAANGQADQIETLHSVMRGIEANG